MNRQYIIRSISLTFPTTWHNDRKVGVNQGFDAGCGFYRKSVCGNQEGAEKGFNTTKKVGRYENQHQSVWARYVQVAQKQVNKVAFVPNGQRIKSIQGWSLTKIGHD